MGTRGHRSSNYFAQKRHLSRTQSHRPRKEQQNAHQGPSRPRRHSDCGSSQAQSSGPNPIHPPSRNRSASLLCSDLNRKPQHDGSCRTPGPRATHACTQTRPAPRPLLRLGLGLGRRRRRYRHGASPYGVVRPGAGCVGGEYTGT
ncbi:hypothetical protein BJV78DRAFT_1219710 [Lactifluus subvellereus]|nr:hypothetical protein BJV78DRAFT_1219710 [Lactifluus subvellereus]